MGDLLLKAQERDGCCPAVSNPVPDVRAGCIEGRKFLDCLNDCRIRRRTALYEGRGEKKEILHLKPVMVGLLLMYLSYGVNVRQILRLH